MFFFPVARSQGEQEKENEKGIKKASLNRHKYFLSTANCQVRENRLDLLVTREDAFLSRRKKPR
jgi:hypothetical protein